MFRAHTWFGRLLRLYCKPLLTPFWIWRHYRLVHVPFAHDSTKKTFCGRTMLRSLGWRSQRENVLSSIGKRHTAKYPGLQSTRLMDIERFERCTEWTQSCPQICIFWRKQSKNGTVLRKSLVKTVLVPGHFEICRLWIRRQRSCAFVVQDKIVYISIICVRSFHENRDAELLTKRLSTHPDTPDKLNEIFKLMQQVCKASRQKQTIKKWTCFSNQSAKIAQSGCSRTDAVTREILRNTQTFADPRRKQLGNYTREGRITT